MIKPRKRCPDVLIVEDDADGREALAELLSDHYLVATVANGQEALSFLRANPDVRAVLLDLYAPTMNGYEFRMAQLSDPLIANIPVIIITGTEKSKAAMWGCAYIQKPVCIDELLEMIHRVASPPS